MNIKSIEYARYTCLEFYLYSIIPPFFFSTKLNYHIGEKRIAIERKITFTSRVISLQSRNFSRKKKKKD